MTTDSQRHPPVSKPLSQRGPRGVRVPGRTRMAGARTRRLLWPTSPPVIATAVNADRHGEIPGAFTTEGGTAWTTSLRGLVATVLLGAAAVPGPPPLEPAQPGAQGSPRSRLRGSPIGPGPARHLDLPHLHPARPGSKKSGTGRSSGGSSRASRRPPSCWVRPVSRSWPMPICPKSTGGRSGPTTRRSAQPGDLPAHRRGRHLPHRTAAIRRVGAILAKQNDGWLVARRSLGVESLFGSRRRRRPPGGGQPIIL